THHGDLVGIDERDHAEPVFVLEDAAHTFGIVRRRRERIEIRVVLDADHERIEPPERSPPITNGLAFLERRTAARRRRAVGRAIRRHRIELPRAARALLLELRDQRSQRLDLRGRVVAAAQLFLESADLALERLDLPLALLDLTLDLRTQLGLLLGRG